MKLPVLIPQSLTLTDQKTLQMYHHSVLHSFYEYFVLQYYCKKLYQKMSQTSHLYGISVNITAIRLYPIWRTIN